MIKYRINTEIGYTEFKELSDECLGFHAEFGLGEIETINYEIEPEPPIVLSKTKEELQQEIQLLLQQVNSL